VLTLRRGTVLAAGDPRGPMQELDVRLGTGRRPALADVALVGPSAAGDEVLVNVVGMEPELGGTGFDLVHANLTRGLRAEAAPPARATKLDYTSLQHAVRPVEEAVPVAAPLRLPSGAPVAVAVLHAQLTPLAWAFHEAAPGARLGYVQTAGGALPGGLSETVRLLRERSLLAGHLTAGPAFGGEAEALTTAGALQHGFAELHWHAAVCGPGPAATDPASALGHAGLVALDSAHTAAALGCQVVVVLRRSSADPRPHHHTATMLRLALVPVIAATPGDPPPPDLRRHDWRRGAADLDGFRASGLPARVLGRTIEEDPAFFSAALAAGSVLAATMRAA
jgi:hypothetical protein